VGPEVAEETAVAVIAGVVIEVAEAVADDRVFSSPDTF
jgi:hypothetical protein